MLAVGISTLFPSVLSWCWVSSEKASLLLHPTAEPLSALSQQALRGGAVPPTFGDPQGPGDRDSRTFLVLWSYLQHKSTREWVGEGRSTHTPPRGDGLSPTVGLMKIRDKFLSPPSVTVLGVWTLSLHSFRVSLNILFRIQLRTRSLSLSKDHWGPGDEGAGTGSIEDGGPRSLYG